MDSLSSSFTQAQSPSVMPSATQDISGPVSEAWWKEASVYQIYPSSFKDSNGDGIGDIPGVIEKLDYFKNLGVDIVWLCPVYPSPQVDMGYDVADYCDIDPQYGTMADVERLIDGLHSRGLKLLMDLVVNHTSDKHKWFQESKSSKDSPYRDWYIWRKPRYDENGERQPPNNWLSYFGGSAWEYDSASDEYYLHLFAKEQPDLNWEHAPVREAVHDIIRFWLGKGVDGFRMDVINFISKQDGLPDATVKIPGAKYQWGDEHYACGPRLHEYLQDIGKILKEYNAFSVGEMPAVQDPKEVIKSVGESRGELNMIFNFEIVDMDHGDGGKFSPHKWEMQDLKRIVNKWQTFMYKNKGWNALYLENHDQARTVSRWASDKPAYRALSAKMLSTFLCFQSGTVFVYQGQELGMANMPADWEMTEHRDLETLNHWEELKQITGSDAAVLEIARKEYQLKSRDHARTPVQWDSSTNAGFSTATPWIRVNDDYKEWNAAAQVSKPESVFEHWKSALALRKELKHIIVYGDFELLDEENADVFAYARSNGSQKVVVVCSFRDREISWSPPVDLQSGKVLLANNAEVNLSQKTISLRPFEAFVCQLH
ncbi:putative alpha-glucosidase (maltase) [Fusarium proliferatum ET1]|uniref:Alpha-glucosidase n=2 Tax=Gibberella intermedia TaxID=948311 RepID=A0A420TRM2_GIBIN|nr:putative alpha-glucosidase (maltase) [Fusarium proliferatum ET1]RKL44163.1 Alpha-glucosidase [Fusarium proliferatum]CZR44452.1 probable alpha-glucosidase (maltase) [Fusarium proliferatum ET1]